MGNDERQLYNMQRANSGSLFPTSFYFGKRPSVSKSTVEEVETVDSREELAESFEELEQERDTQKQRLMSRSFPENEFRNITRTIEENPEERNTEHIRRSPSGSLSSSSTLSYVEPEQSLLDTVLSSFESGSNRQRSRSEVDLRSIDSSFKDELATRLTMDKNIPRQPQDLTLDKTDVQHRNGQLKEENGKRTDVQTKSTKNDPFFGSELATFLTMPKKPSAVRTYEDSRPDQTKLVKEKEASYENKRSSVPIAEDEGPKTTKWNSSSNESSVPREPLENFKPLYGDEYSTTLTFPKQQQQLQEHQQQQWQKKQRPLRAPPPPPPQQQQQLHQPLVQHVIRPTETVLYQQDPGQPQFNNRYEQVSEMLTSEKPKVAEVRYVEESQDVSYPVRPPRKKDKNKTKSGILQEVNNKTDTDFDSLSEFLGNENAAMFLSSERHSDSGLRDNHGEYRRVSLPTYSERREREDDRGFAPQRNSQRADTPTENHVQGNMMQRRSGDFSKTNLEFQRRKSDGYPRQKEVSLDHPRRRTANNYPDGLQTQRPESYSKHVLPGVLLDRKSVSNYPEEQQFPTTTSRRLSSPQQGGAREEPRVPPPYRPPPPPDSLSKKVRQASRPSYPPPNVPPHYLPNYPPPNFAPNNVPPPGRRSQGPSDGRTSIPSDPPPNVPRNHQPSNVSPHVQPTHRSQDPGNYSPRHEVSLDHPRRRSMNYPTDEARPLTTNAAYNYEVSARNGPLRQSGGVEYGQEMATVLVPRWERQSESTVALNNEPGYIVAKQVTVGVDNEPSERWPSRDLIDPDVSSPGEVVIAGNINHSEESRNNSYQVNRIPNGNRVDIPSERRRASDHIPTRNSFETVNNETLSVRHEKEKDMDIVSSFLGEEMTNKWFSNTGDTPGPSEENRQMYRVTSMI